MRTRNASRLLKEYGPGAAAAAAVVGAVLLSRRSFASLLSLMQPSIYPANIRAMLATIRACEGTAGSNGYRMLFGGKLFTSFADHPRITQYPVIRGVKTPTSAAGAYQIIRGTWDNVARKLRLPDFSPASQDAAAVELIRQRGAYADLIAGKLWKAVTKLGAEWASLPTSTANQPVKTTAYVQKTFLAAGGKIS